MLEASDFLRRECFEIVSAVAGTGSGQIATLAEHLARTSGIPAKAWILAICDCCDSAEVLEHEVPTLISWLRQGCLEGQLGRVLRRLAGAPLDGELRREARRLYLELDAVVGRDRETGLHRDQALRIAS
jgi:hypothetical protein